MAETGEKTKGGAEKAEKRPLPIIFDTSVLYGMRPESPSPEFKHLIKLCELGKVRLLIPEMAAREWISQRADSAIGDLESVRISLRAAKRHESLKANENLRQLIETDTNLGMTLDAIREHCEAWHHTKLSELGLDIVELDLDDHKNALDGYFNARLPFKERRSRKHYQDALVLTGVSKIHADDSRTIVVCHDGPLREAAVERGIIAVSSFEELLRYEVVAMLQIDAKFDEWWKANLQLVVGLIQETEDSLVDALDDYIVDVITGVTIVDPEIPDDNGEALVQSAGEFTDFEFDWDNAESLGEGVVSIPMSFDAAIDLDFYVFRAEAFEVPDWVSVSMGDFERDHYLDASGSRVARYSARLVLDVGTEVMSGQLGSDTIELSVEDAEFEKFID